MHSSAMKALSTGLLVEMKVSCKSTVVQYIMRLPRKPGPVWAAKSSSLSSKSHRVESPDSHVLFSLLQASTKHPLVLNMKLFQSNIQGLSTSSTRFGMFERTFEDAPLPFSRARAHPSRGATVFMLFAKQTSKELSVVDVCGETAIVGLVTGGMRI